MSINRTRVFRRRWSEPVLISVAALAVYLPHLGSAFQYDDIHSIVDNPHLRSLKNLDDFFWRADMFTADPKSAMYRPLVLASYAMNFALGGYFVEGYRLFNIAVHVGCSLLLYSLVRQWGPAGIAATAGLLFAINPITSEPVMYISSRSESLCALMALATLFLYGMRASRAAFVGSIVTGICALLAKSVAIVVPMCLFMRERSVLVRNWMRVCPHVLVAVAYIATVRQALQTALVDQPVRTFEVQILTQAKALVYYGKLLALPVNQSVEHQFTPGSWGLAVVAALVLLGSLLFAAVALWRHRGWRHSWMVWPVLFLLPTFFVPLNVLINEHRLYVPVMAWSMAVAWATRLGMRRWGGEVILALALIFGALTYQRGAIWQTPQTLWSDTLAKAPMMPRPHLYMGDEYRKKSLHAEALAFYQRALTVQPGVLSGGDQLAICNNTGATYLAMGRNVDAARWYRHALAIDPTYEKARTALDGIAALSTAELRPDTERNYKEAMMLLVAGDLDGALVAMQTVLVGQRHPKIYQGLGLTYERLGRPVDATTAYRAALSMPGLAEGLRDNLVQRIQILEEESQ